MADSAEACSLFMMAGRLSVVMSRCLVLLSESKSPARWSIRR